MGYDRQPNFAKRIELWDLVRKLSNHLDEIDVAILFGIYKKHSKAHIARALKINRTTIYRRLESIAISANYLIARDE
ncbi:MAG: hypothetical protein KAS32_04260 [Candidatus Peribacteraceae bacterium]|nr:hypothetical protein [Candidatus Peribacteraceae bacterium]